MTDTQRNDGGPAFPGEYYEKITCPDGTTMPARRTSSGMSLRDYFAAAALTGLVASKDPGSINEITECAYDYADAMLAERDKRENQQ